MLRGVGETKGTGRVEKGVGTIDAGLLLSLL